MTPFSAPTGCSGGDEPVQAQPPGRTGSAWRARRGRPGPAGAGDWCGAARRLRAAAPAARHSWRLTNDRAGPASRRAERRSGRAGGETQLIMMPYADPDHRCSSRTTPTSGTHRAFQAGVQQVEQRARPARATEVKGPHWARSRNPLPRPPNERDWESIYVS